MNEKLTKNLISVTPTSRFNAQSFPLVKGQVIKLTQEELDEIGKTKQFDLENLRIIDYDPETDPEAIEQRKQEEIAVLKAYLASTDWVITKISEADTVEEQTALREKYADTIAQRKAARARINELDLI